MQLFNLANFLTLINLFSGCMAAVFVFKDRMEYVPYCILISLVADFFDGFAARLIKNPTDLGKQLDSLADVVSFGFVPGAVVFQLLFRQYEAGTGNLEMHQLLLYSCPAFIITLFAALRLAKFNIDTRQGEGFIGLATPAAAIFIIGLLLTGQHNSLGLGNLANDKITLYTVIPLLAFLMVAELPMFSFKFKSVGWADNRVRYLFIILSVVLIVSLKFAAVPLIIIVYILISIALKLFRK